MAVIDKPIGLAIEPTDPLVHPARPLFRIGGQLRPELVEHLDYQLPPSLSGMTLRRLRQSWRHQPEEQVAYRGLSARHLFEVTAGVYVAARDEASRAALTETFRARAFRQRYRAIVSPPPPQDEGSLLVHGTGGRRTRWQVVERFAELAALLAYATEEGPDHPVPYQSWLLWHRSSREALAAAGWPIVGDHHLDRRPRRPSGLYDLGRWLRKEVLQSREVTLRHPVTGDRIACTSEPVRMPDAIDALRAAAAGLHR
jgi:hypothetical protein